MSQFQISEKEYGKTGVKLLFVSKEGGRHTIKELEVETSLTLNSEKDFRSGDNSDIIATDSQKNTVYILSKQYGVESPEQFALVLANHFIKQYSWVVRARVDISENSWSRIIDRQGAEHNHAFTSGSPTGATRTAQVILHRSGEPKITAGIRGLTVLKTTQSAFVDFVDDEYRSLPDMHERVFSTVVTADWEYKTKNMDFDKAYRVVESCILEVFGGPAKTGIYSPSVQQTQFLTQQLIFKKLPQVMSVKMSMPNRHYFNVDFAKFKMPGLREKEGAGQVLLPVDKPSGMISSTLKRDSQKSKL